MTALHALGRWAARLAPVVLLSLAGFVLWRELRSLDLGDVGDAMAAWGPARIAAAVGFTTVSYTLLATIEWLGLGWSGARIPFRTVMLGAFTANAFAHTLGFGILVGGAVRAKLYVRSGVPLSVIARTTIFGSATFGLGILSLAGLALLGRPDLPILGVRLPAHLGIGAGAILVAIPAAYMAACARLRRPVRIGGQALSLPSFRVSASQVLLGLADNVVCGAVVWILLGPMAHAYSEVAAAYAIGTLAGALSNIPGGAGVFEGVLLTLMPDVARPILAAAFLGNRLIYYVLPLILAAALLAPRVLGPASWRGLATSWRAAGPWVAAAVAFALGASLILTGVGRIAPARLALLRETVPALVLDTTHLLSLVSGLALMAVSLLLWRRYATAVPVAVGAALIGAATALLRGLDIGPALASLAFGLAIWLGRGAFPRRGGWTGERLLPWWLAGMAAVLIGSLGLGLWIYADTPYEARLWDQIGYRADPARFVRGMAVAGAALLAGGAWALAHGVGPRAVIADAAALDAIRPLVEAEADTTARLALTGDKALLRSEAGDAFIMYAAEGRSLIAMANPVGDPAAAPALLWRFKETADAAAARPVIYHASPHWLTAYLDLGLSLLKLGEEAHVPLKDFDLEASERRKLRQSHAKAIREGLGFEVACPPQSDALLAELEVISDGWLLEHGGHEKGFSLGRFDRATLRREPIALVRHAGRVVAFANIWAGGRTEASIDLMRRAADAPHGVMDFLFVELILWAKGQDFERFNLGMAPLSGFAHHPLAPAWHKLGALIALRGGRFYGFAGLRAFKAKFSPEWMPRYLAAPPTALAAAMLDVTRLVNRPRPPT
jgi:phosphatidylglycerol lysyltransferase